VKASLASQTYGHDVMMVQPQRGCPMNVVQGEAKRWDYRCAPVAVAEKSSKVMPQDDRIPEIAGGIISD